MNKVWVIYVTTLLIIFIVVSDMLFHHKFASDLILGITAIIIMWYTWETYKIREAESSIAKTSSEAFTRIIRPIAGFRIFTNEKNPLDTGFEIINHSEYPVAALVKCNFKLDGKLIKNVWPAYDGKEYWNLQYKQLKCGYFNWLDLYNNLEIFSEEDIKELKINSPEQVRKKITGDLILLYDLKEPPKLTIDLEVYCENDLEQIMYYPPSHYELDPFRLSWKALLTSERPYWEFSLKPGWVNKIK